MDSNKSYWVLIGPYVSLSILMSLYGSLCVYMDSNRSLCGFIGPLSSLWILMRFYWSL